MQLNVINLLAITALFFSQALALPTLLRRQCGDDTVNVASSFSPAIQCSELLDNDDVDLSPDISILRRRIPTTVAGERLVAVVPPKSARPLFQRDTASVNSTAADTGNKTMNAAAASTSTSTSTSTSSPSLLPLSSSPSSPPQKDSSAILENDKLTLGANIDILDGLLDIDLAASASAGGADSTTTPDDDSESCGGDGTVNVASSLSPSVQCSRVLSNDTLTVDPTVDIL